MTTTHIHSRYQQIWNNFQSSEFTELLTRGFVYQHDEDEAECELLFIGINPAFDVGSDGPWSGSYSRPSDEARSYFRPFISIANELKRSYNWQGRWTHLDIFVFRETNQKYIETNLLKSPDGIGFLYEQMMIARERILHIKPKVIVVSNALVRMFTGKERGVYENGEEYGVWMGFSFEFDRVIGTDVIVEPEELRGIPVFFSSMLSGQRALDTGSRERLIWHVGRALESCDEGKAEVIIE